ncbi:hypothetical protein [Leptotrichia wadei]|uniref:hypothetical protein n=1 Tax=Leptotrichia wadei TaxID=157687 RepID=UPI0028D11CE0|nr:hypothetical protein [Leptotrichia wadei]
MRKIKQKNNFTKKNYRHFLVSEVKKEFGNNAKKYIDWEIEVLKVGMKITENREVLEIVDKYKNELIENILQNDNETVQMAMADTIEDYVRMEKEKN